MINSWWYKPDTAIPCAYFRVTIVVGHDKLVALVLWFFLLAWKHISSTIFFHGLHRLLRSLIPYLPLAQSCLTYMILVPNIYIYIYIYRYTYIYMYKYINNYIICVYWPLVGTHFGSTCTYRGIQLKVTSTIFDEANNQSTNILYLNQRTRQHDYESIRLCEAMCL